ncbi:hypothetical protein NMY22_g13267 [Coprinellus aureogranulatus]|nr:hypothetical protein NMY22_g13267 [Coprinellus aureogranulatus]
MPSQNSTEATVLITGANGYIGAWTAKTALERGLSVRAVVESKATWAKDILRRYVDNGKLEFVYVSDMTKEGAFNEAVSGVHAVLHLASPLPSASSDPQETIRLAVDGTLGLLKSAVQNGKNIKRIVITSSIAAIETQQTEPRTFSEADWNESAEAQSKDVSDPFFPYRASKTFAERAAWSFFEEHKSSIAWDLVSINPPFVYGPPLQPNIPSPSELGCTQLIWWNTVVRSTAGEKTRESIGPEGGSGWVDVRDVAEAHLRALEREGVSGKRIIVSGGDYIWQEWIDITSRLAPPSLQPMLPKGYPELTSNRFEYHFKYDASKSLKLLHMNYRTKERTVRDILADAEKRGWLHASSVQTVLSLPIVGFPLDIDVTDCAMLSSPPTANMSTIDSTIHDLPVEILEKVFSGCLQHSRPTISRSHPAVVVSHVCREWRSIALNSSMLWTNMHIRVPGPDDFPMFDAWCTAVGHTVSAIEEWLKRSAPRIIKITIDIFTFTPTHILRTIFQVSGRWEEVSVHFHCNSTSAPLLYFMRVCQEYPSPADSFPNLESIVIRITARNVRLETMDSLSSSIMRSGMFSGPSLRRITTRGQCRISNTGSLKEWSRGCSQLTEIHIDPPNIDLRPPLFDPSDALCLFGALPGLTRASLGFQHPWTAAAIATRTRVTVPQLVFLSLHGIPAGPEFARALRSQYGWLTQPPGEYAEGILEFLRIFGEQLKGLALNPAPFPVASLDSCLDRLDNERLETLSLIHTHFPVPRRQEVYGIDSEHLDLLIDRRNHAALRYIANPSVFPNLKHFEMNLYNICSGDTCSKSILTLIASRRGQPMDGGSQSIARLGGLASRAQDLRISLGFGNSTEKISGLVHGAHNHIQDVHIIFSRPSTVDIVDELRRRRVDMGFNLRLNYPDFSQSIGTTPVNPWLSDTH